MDSKLVVEQMSGNWKIKHADMKPLALEANRLAPFGTTYTWVPREQNKHADRLANEALDGKRSGVTVPSASDGVRRRRPMPTRPRPSRRPSPSWIAWRRQVQTTLVLVRHGVTDHTRERRFSGGLAGANPGLSDEGRAQVRATADGLRPWASRRRRGRLARTPTRESAEILAERLAVPLEEEPGFAEMEFGTWDGMTFDEVARAARGAREVARLARGAPGGGESLRDGRRSACWPPSTGCWPRTPGRTVVVASHVTPIKIVVARRCQAPLDASVPDGAAPGVGHGACRSSPRRGRGAGDPQRYASLRRCNTLRARRRPARRVDPLVAAAGAQTSLTTTSSGCRPAPRLAPSLDRPARGRASSARERGRRARVGAVLEQRADQPALGRLVEVADHGAPAVGLVQHPHGRHPARQVGRRPPEGGVRRGAQVHQQPAAERLAHDRRRASGSRHSAGDRAEPGSEASPESGRPGSGRRAGPARTATRRPRPGVARAARRRQGRVRRAPRASYRTPV